MWQGGLDPSTSVRAVTLLCMQVAGIEGLASLHVLSVADNHLTSFSSAAPAAGKQVAGVAVSPLTGCGASLWELHAASNRLADLQGLSSCTALTHLDVSRNQLHSLAGIQGCLLLRHLDASHNCLDAWPGDVVAGMLHLRYLDLSGNTIPALASTSPNTQMGSSSQAAQPPSDIAAPALLLPPSLDTLLLQDNQVSWVSQLLQGPPALTRLDLSFNNVQELCYLHALAPLSALAQLQLNDNPVSSHEGYPQALHAACPQLRELDGVPIPAAQRAMHIARAVTSSPVLVPATQALLRSMAVHDVTSAVSAAASIQQAARCAAGTSAGAGPAHGLGTGSLLELVAAVQMQSAAAQLTQSLVQAPSIVEEQSRGSHEEELHSRVASVDQLFLSTTVQSTLHTTSDSSSTASWLRSQNHAARASAVLASSSSSADSSGQAGTTQQPAAAGHTGDVVAQWHAHQLQLPSMSRLKQLAMSVGHLSVAGAARGQPHSTAAAAVQDVAWGEYWLQHGQAQHELHVQQLNEVQQLAQGDGAMPSGSEQLIVHSSFFERREASLAKHAARIQAAWRGHTARTRAQVSLTGTKQPSGQ